MTFLQSADILCVVTDTCYIFKIYNPCMERRIIMAQSKLFFQDRITNGNGQIVLLRFWGITF